MSNGEARVETQFRKLLMDRSPTQRLAMASRMFATARSLVCAGLLREHGSLDPNDLREHLFLRFYGRDFGETEMAKIFDSWKTT